MFLLVIAIALFLGVIVAQVWTLWRELRNGCTGRWTAGMQIERERFPVVFWIYVAGRIFVIALLLYLFWAFSAVLLQDVARVDFPPPERHTPAFLAAGPAFGVDSYDG